MKKLFYFFATVALLLTACKGYDDSELMGRVDNLEERVSKLETLCNRMNTDISSLQTIVSALQKNDYITSITPVTEGDTTIGYTITFAKSLPITIYHGKDGKDGADGKYGKDGYTPVIGVRQDTDGIYYWTLDGEWLLEEAGNKIKAVGTDGKDGIDGKDGVDGIDGKDGQNGQNGQNGADGTNGTDGKDGVDGKDGQDGITPQLKIEDDYWYVSYDNGTTWVLLGKATGENGKDGANGTNGTDGANGEDGDSFFQSVDTTNDDYVVFTLADGTTIKIPTWHAFEQLQTLCNEMNTNISSLQTIVTAMQNNDYITSCTPLIENGVQIGYTITFAKQGSIVIYHGQKGDSGEDGKTPIIGVKNDNDGIPYWTLNNEWLLDGSGNKVRVHTKDGITPKFKIENGYWYISYDNETSWTQLGQAKGDNGDSLFKSITQDENNVYLEMADGNIITIAKNYNLSITFNPDDLGKILTPGNVYTIRYTVQSGTSSVDIELVPSGNITTRVIADNESKLTGSIEITAGQTADAETNLIVFLYNGNKVIMKSLEFEVAGLKIYDQAVIDIPNLGGYANLEFLSNIECVPVIPSSAQSWISVVPATKSVLQYNSIRLSVSPNNKSTARSATIRVESADGAFGVEYIINQAGGQPNSEIWYTSTTGSKIDLSKEMGFGSTFLTNTYSNGKGVIKFESDITQVAISGFENCKNLASIALPASITSVGEKAFSGCSNLREIELPQGTTSIGNAAFKECTSLIDIKIPDFCNYIGTSAFSGCVSLVAFKMPSAVTSVSASLLENCTALSSILLSDNIITIGGSAFSGCSSLRNITIPNGITTIGKKAFYKCSGITSITIPESVITIEPCAFANCKLLTSVTLGSNITSIGGWAFWDCDCLTEITIPNSVVSIDKAAFSRCDGLRKVTIGESIATIGSGAFYKCPHLVDIYIKATNPPVLYAGFYDEIDGNIQNTSWSGLSYIHVFQYSYDSDPRCTIYVPLYSLNKYKTDWGRYTTGYQTKEYVDCLEGYEFN